MTPSSHEFDRCNKWARGLNGKGGFARELLESAVVIASKDQGDEHRDAARAAVRGVWAHYKPTSEAVEPQSNVAEHMRRHEDYDSEDDMNSQLLDLVSASGRMKKRRIADQLDSFVEGDRVAIAPLDYWKSGDDEYKDIRRMARDYFCIPATSAPSERAFTNSRFYSLY
ncbi:hypothetical protein DFQ27_004536 [Actinomortierella ambigua]|uniref:HAT C-terminal dimerisation domain-containing protein n=1 Tax=Actinomortierella ambigua TaxID=1343610 RepID=A0A9P6Q2W9_9FUNG|nr:hypothetical protein DFQ27_004536 [Actinomortierella ambigua]